MPVSRKRSRTPAMIRRDFLKTTLLGTAALVGGPSLRALGAPVTPARSGGTPLKGPIFNQDDSEFFMVRPPAEMTGESVDAWVDSLAAAGIGTLMSCVCAARANYASRAWEPRWTGYDPKGPDDQPVLAHMPKDGIKAVRRWLESEKALAEAGINFHERAFARCKKHGIGAWASIRMNDLHDCSLPDSPLLSTFYKDQRDRGLIRVPYRMSGWPERALDWGRPEVRDYYMKLVREVLSFRGIEGLELDWMRFGWHFRIGRELEGGEILTQWISQVRQLCNAAAAREGHPVRLGCRVPSHPETARLLGMDGVQWARKGLIDLLVPTPFWATCEFDMPIREWKRLLEGTKCALAGGLEINYRPWPGGNASMLTPELAAGAAMAVLAGGSDYVYLFNYFADLHLGGLWSLESFNHTLAAMRGMESLNRLPRRHAVTYRDIVAPGEASGHLLPADPGFGIFRLQTGAKPTGRKVQLLLELEAAGEHEPAAPTVRINATPCPDFERQGKCVLLYTVPPEALTDGLTVVETMNAGSRIMRVEIAVAAA